jgi:hypothetical protein
MNRTFLLITLSFLLLCFNLSDKYIGYNFKKPDAKLILPPILQEISGLTYIDSISFACIQDEDGVLFIYDIAKNKIREQYVFGLRGDYEGITKVNETIYVLRSDGALLEITNYRSKNFKVAAYITGIPANNNEGLCYDEENNRLLIACKGKIEKGPGYKDIRLIYGFDLKTKKLIPKPVFEFNVQVIKQFAIDNKVPLPVRIKKKGLISEPILKFATSAICLHPVTKKLYLLSATDHLLFVFNMNGTTEHIEKLDPVVYNKAEGVTFFGNGDMLITNEGQDKNPTLLRLNYKK